LQNGQPDDLPSGQTSSLSALDFVNSAICSTSSSPLLLNHPDTQQLIQLSKLRRSRSPPCIGDKEHWHTDTHFCVLTRLRYAQRKNRRNGFFRVYRRAEEPCYTPRTSAAESLSLSTWPQSYQHGIVTLHGHEAHCSSARQEDLAMQSTTSPCSTAGKRVGVRMARATHSQCGVATKSPSQCCLTVAFIQGPSSTQAVTTLPY
jgi:hypothetical protein